MEAIDWVPIGCRINGFAPPDPVDPTVASVEHIGSGTASEYVPTAAAGDGVVAPRCVERCRTVVTDERVVAESSSDILKVRGHIVVFSTLAVVRLSVEAH